MSSKNALVKSDKDLNRNSTIDFAIAVGTPVILLFLGYMIGYSIAVWFGFPSFIGWSIGLGGASFVAKKLWDRSQISNGATNGFLAIDPIASMFPYFGLPTFVIFGPGDHWCKWWLQRHEENSISLKESTEGFQAVVQTNKGALTFKGELRLRPNLLQLVEFINGVAAVVSDATGLIQAEIVNEYSGGNNDLQTVLGSVTKLNTKLDKKFRESKVKKVTDFEGRFGVTIGDVTITEILPSKEVQETFGALTESALIDQMVATTFGCATYIELVEKIDSTGKPTWAQAGQVRTQKMAMSRNLDGMDLKDHTFNLNISGLDSLSPEAATALAAGVSMYAGRNQSASTKQKGNKK